MSVRRYVVVDLATKAILGGPWLWDGATQWDPPVAGTLMLASDAQSSGYATPATSLDVGAQNTATLQQRIAQAIDANAQFLALGTPTTAQAVAQVQRLTREVTALIRLTAGLLDTTDGT